MFIQSLTILLYFVFACIVLFLWPAYRLCVKNLILFVGFGGIGFIFIGFVSGILVNTLESSTQILVVLSSLALGLFAGSYFGLRSFGTKSNSL